MVDEATLQLVRSYMQSVRIPGHHDKVYKDECVFSYDTPESPGGLYISLTTFQGFGQDYVQVDFARTGNALYLHEKWTPVPRAPENDEAVNGSVQLGEGKDGGLRLALGGKPRVHLDKKQHLVVLGAQGPLATVPLPCPELPERVLQSIAAIMAHESVSMADTAAVWEEERRVSRYAADLPQLDSEGKRISPNPKDWRCEETGATDNLWLNLSTGFIGSGRQTWVGTGGNSSALHHYEAMGRKYPLVVKLGTITPHGADVYSYAPDEDDMVLDPYLDKHLAHWGINMMQMQKTDKTMAELQVEFNQSHEFSRITEAGGALKPLQGPQYTGLINLGNSCYMNSVLQVLTVLPGMRQRYVDKASHIFSSAPSVPADDLPTQLAKVCVALELGRTGFSTDAQGDVGGKDKGAAVLVDAMEVDGAAGAALATAAVPKEQAWEEDAEVRTRAVRPQSFKTLVGRGHPEFSTSRQQDALEFYTHLMELVARAEHQHGARLAVEGQALGGAAPTRSALTFRLEDRLQCTESGAVRYTPHEEQWLALDVPLDAATNKEQVEAYREREARRERLKVEDAHAYIGADHTIAPATAGGPDGGNAASALAVSNSLAGPGGAAQEGVVSASDKEPKVVPKVPFAACLAAWAADEVVSDVWSAAAGKRCPALKRTRFSTFPPFLMVALKRYYTSENWVPKKMEVEVEVPERLSLEALRSAGPQSGEQLQPADPVPATGSGADRGATVSPQPAQPVANPELVASLVAMGFSQEACTRAALAMGNSGLEAAMEWILAHLEDPDINDPLPSPPCAAAAAADKAGVAATGGGGDSTTLFVDAVTLAQLTSMGFTDTQAGAALKACSNNVERAVDWLFSHTDDMDAAVAAVLQPGPSTTAVAAGAALKALLDGPGEYELVGIISHMGANTSCGHYVAHIKKSSKWCIFNDEKVAESEHPPRELGYMYLFQRATPTDP